MSITGINNSSSSIYGLQNTNNASGTFKTDGTDMKREPPDINKMVSDLTSMLGLNDNQMIQLKSILQKSFSENESSQSTSSTDATANSKYSMRTKMKEKMDQMNNSIMNILTSEQQDKFQTFLSNMKPPEPPDNSGNYA